MLTRNHPTDNPESPSIFRVLMHSGAVITLIADYCTTGGNEHINGFVFWKNPAAGAAHPACVGIFARDAIAAIIILA